MADGYTLLHGPCMVDLASAILVAALGGGTVGAVVSYFNTRREVSTRMIELAVRVLCDSPKDTHPALREWAAKLLAHYCTRVPIDERVQRELREEPLFGNAVGKAAGRSHADAKSD